MFPNRVIGPARVSLAARFAILMTATAFCGPGAAAQPEREQGVRLRLYWVGQRMTDHAELVPDQSPNVDLTIPALTVTGQEEWFTPGEFRFTDDYLLRLDAELTVSLPGRYEFRLAEADMVRLFIDEGPVASVGGAGHRDHAEPAAGAVTLTAGVHRLRLLQTVSGAKRGLSVLWRGPNSEVFRPIPASALTAEAFYFRPTNSGKKRLVDHRDRPGKRRKLAGLRPDLEIATIRPAGVDVPVGGLDTVADGRLIVAVFDARRLRAPRPTQDPNGELWIYENPHAENCEDIRRRRIAEGLFEPCGVCVVGEAIYVSQRDEVTRFDFDAASNTWRPTTVATGWKSNDFHALSFGLSHQPGHAGHPGYLYLGRGTGLGLFRNPPNHGSVWKIDLALPAGKNVEPITGGHRTPNGLGFNAQGEIFVTDNQGEYTPCNELNHVQRGRFYGFFQQVGRDGAASPFQDEAERLNPDRSVTEAAVMLPQDEIANSPSEPALIPAGWPFAGQMMLGDVKYGGLNRVYLEKVDGAWQGAAFRFTQGLEGGVNRLEFGPDGSLYVGCIGGDHAATWNWVNPDGKRTYQGLQRLRPTGKPVFDLDRVSITAGGFEVSFTQPVDRAWLADPRHYEVSQWTYRATPRYGGPKVDFSRLSVWNALPAADGKRVRLAIDGVRRDYVVHIVTDPRSETGEPIWSTEAWYTVRRMPE